jgi:hypothetical protein
MKNLLLTVGVVAVGYAIYNEWLKNQQVKKVVDNTRVQTDIALKKVSEMTGNNMPLTNRETFGAMKGFFDADISKTVAPSVNAKIGIF